MGISIYSPGSDVCMDMSAGSFFRLRVATAKNLNKRFGDHYSTLLSCSDHKEWCAQMDKIIEEEHLGDKRWQCSLLDFFFETDVKGLISYGTAKRIYDLVKNEPDDNKYGYIGWTHCSTMGDFKKILLDAHRNKTVVRWD